MGCCKSKKLSDKDLDFLKKRTRYLLIHTYIDCLIATMTRCESNSVIHSLICTYLFVCLYTRLFARFDEPTIRDWHEGFLQDCPSGRLSKRAFIDMYRMFFPSGDADSFCKNVFRTFDRDGNGYIDFIEFLMAIDVTSAGSPEERLQWAFRYVRVRTFSLLTYRIAIARLLMPFYVKRRLTFLWSPFLPFLLSFPKSSAFSARLLES